MQSDQLYHFLFETYPGIAILFGLTIVICLIACVIMERRTRRIYKNHAKGKDDWSLFDDDDDADSDDGESADEQEDTRAKAKTPAKRTSKK